MTAQAAERTVQRTVTVAAGIEKAFKIFTAGMGTWWPETHHIGKAPLKTQVVEPRAGGRCYEVMVDGSECDWGRVSAWEPPKRVVLAWHLGADWQYDADPTHASEVEVRFIAEGQASTRVVLEHRHFERHGPTGEVMKKSVAEPGGWNALLTLYAKAVAA